LDDSIQAPLCIAPVQSAIERGAPAQIKVYDDAYHDFDWPGDKLHVVTSQSARTVHYGENENDRVDAITRVPSFLDAYLKP
jgi:dienelactone hydrolase